MPKTDFTVYVNSCWFLNMTAQNFLILWYSTFACCFIGISVSNTHWHLGNRLFSFSFLFITEWFYVTLCRRPRLRYYIWRIRLLIVCMNMLSLFLYLIYPRTFQTFINLQTSQNYNFGCNQPFTLLAESLSI